MHFADFLADQVGWVEDQQGSEEQGEYAHRDVDEEDPVPGVVVGDPAAQGGADDGRHHHAHAVKRHGHALLLAREAFHQDGLGDGLKRPSARALQHAEEDQQAEARRHAAEEGTHGEDDDAGHVEPLAPEQ